MMRHSGVGFPNGPVDNATIFALPSSDLLMLATEGRYHLDEAVRAGKRCLWRAVPRIGKRPAELGWSPARFVAETINLTDAPELPITDFVWANELDLNYERGDSADDWSDLPQRYALIGGWALSVVQSLHQWSPSTRIHWPAWTPDHDALSHLPRWLDAARACDVVDFHAYDSLDRIREQYYAYRNEFTDRPLALTEWHCKGDIEEERRVLAWLAETMQADPLFEAAYFFIWRWHQAAGWWDDAWDIEHNPDRLALFMNPPTVEEPKTVYRVPTWTPAYEHIRDGAIQVADERGLPRRRLLGLCLAESGFSLQSFDRWASIERSARMVAAIQQSDWPRVEAIFDEIQGTPTNDLSWGPCHQTWYWSDEYPGDRSPGDPHRHNLAEIMEFRAHYIEDHGAALRVAAGKITGDGDDLDILCLYNKPGVPPAANPNRPNYVRALAEADRVLAELPDGPVEPASVQYEDFRDPEPAGRFGATPKGIILHGSRSGKAGNPQEQEYKGTASWEVNNPVGLGWHATVADHRVAVHLDPRQWGWHALEASKVYIGVELAQPTVNDPITDAQVDAVADWIKTRVLPVWPGLPMHFPSHPEVDREFGVNQGKSDAFPIGDPRMDDLRARLMARLEADDYHYVFGFADLASRLGHGVVGDPLENEHVSERHGHPISHQLTTRGEMVYWQSANRADFYPAA